MAKAWNKKIFKNIHEKVNQASKDLAEERGACPDAAEYGYKERFSNKTAIAPTASISIICGGVQVLNLSQRIAILIKLCQDLSTLEIDI